MVPLNPSPVLKLIFAAETKRQTARIQHFSRKKQTIYLPCIYSDKCLKGAVVSRTWNILNGVNYNNTETVPLILIIFILSPQRPIPIGFQFRKYLRIWKKNFKGSDWLGIVVKLRVQHNNIKYCQIEKMRTKKEYFLNNKYDGNFRKFY